MKGKVFLLACILFVFLYSCKKTDEKIDMTETPVALNIPQFFPKMNIPADNQMTEERLALGRKLYYDPILSNDGRSCSSCHFQTKGFTSDVASGPPVLPHINLGWNTNFLWKGEKANGLEDIMMFEVNDFFGTDLNKLNANEGYKNLFMKAYGVSTIGSKDVAYALAQFFRSMISGNSRFDKFRRHEISLTASEQSGMEIFFTEKGDCFHCHGGMLLTDNSFHNIGLDSVFTPGNKGRFDVTGIETDAGLYKTPTLRNCELRTQFMHDGRFSTLEEVVDFYNSGFHQSSPNIDPLMLLPAKVNGLQLSTQEKADLVAFLKTFTDYDFINNKTLSAP